jgi:hypothetical protein
MSDNTRHCYMCCQTVEARVTPSGWMHCPRCGANIGFSPPAAPPYVYTEFGHNIEALAPLSTTAFGYDKARGYLFGSPEDPTLHHKPRDDEQRPVLDFMEPPGHRPTNPKTLMGRQKLSMLSVVPPASIICEAEAMHYGAFEAPRKDGKKGYGPYNWRDDPVELMIYLDAAARHILAFIDGEEYAPDSLASHLGHAKACLGIIADAKANGTLIDDRPKVRKGAASTMLSEWKQIHAIHTGEPT